MSNSQFYTVCRIIFMFLSVLRWGPLSYQYQWGIEFPAPPLGTYGQKQTNIHTVVRFGEMDYKKSTRPTVSVTILRHAI